MAEAEAAFNPVKGSKKISFLKHYAFVGVTDFYGRVMARPELWTEELGLRNVGSVSGSLTGPSDCADFCLDTGYFVLKL